MKTQYFDAVCSVDFETFYDPPRYSLGSKHLSMTDYIRHEEFQTQAVAIQHSSWKRGKVVAGNEAEDLLGEIDWAETAFLAHHTQFDGLIATHHYGIEPVFWMDTMSMSRVLHGVDVGHSFNLLSKRLGRTGKTKAAALKSIAGKRLEDFTPEELANLMAYNLDDCEDTLLNFYSLEKTFQLDELRTIDITMRMYCEPLIELDGALLTELNTRETARRLALFEKAGVTAKVLGSANQFAEALLDLGVIPPMKMSLRTKKPTYAFSKTDLEFKALLDHPDEPVRNLVAARFGAKGNLVENRSGRMMMRLGEACPVYLGYWAARTGRWGGGDKINLQNLPSRGDGANLRRALLAPDGARLIIADASQIEARMLAWLARFKNKLDAFRAYDRKEGPDLYCVAASSIYGRPINPEDDPDERFVGKVLELSGGYGAGALRIQKTFKLGSVGPPIDMPINDVRSFVARWRIANAPIIQYWEQIETAARTSFLENQVIELGPLTFERYKADGYMHMPNGTYQKYTRIGYDAETGSLFYNSRNGSVKLWGGLLTENADQGLSCALLKQHMLWMTEEMPDLRIALLVHDETVCLATTDVSEEYAHNVKRIMSTPADWCQGLPLNAAVKVSEIYNKS